MGLLWLGRPDTTSRDQAQLCFAVARLLYRCRISLGSCWADCSLAFRVLKVQILRLHPRASLLKNLSGWGKTESSESLLRAKAHGVRVQLRGEVVHDLGKARSPAPDGCRDLSHRKADDSEQF